MHSNGGKVLSSEFRDTHFGCSPSVILLPLSLSVSHPAESFVSLGSRLAAARAASACSVFFGLHFSPATSIRA